MPVVSPCVAAPSPSTSSAPTLKYAEAFLFFRKTERRVPSGTLPRRARRSSHVACGIPRVQSDKRVTLVRHGQSTWNQEGRIQGSSDFSVLTAKGEGQAEMTREALRGYPFDLGFRSPLNRASRTAEVIWDDRSAELRDLWELREIDLYSFQGLLKAEGKAKFGDAYAAWKADPSNFEIDGHFPVRELWTRGGACWEHVLASDGKDVLVVAHNAVIQAMIGNALGLGPEYFRRLVQSNCGLTTFAFSTNGGVALEKLNQTPASPLRGNADGSQSRAVLICASDGQNVNEDENDEVWVAVAGILRDETLTLIQHDGTLSASDAATKVAALLGHDEPTSSSSSIDETITSLRGSGTAILFASPNTVTSVVSNALSIDKVSAPVLCLTRGGLTILDFVGGIENYQEGESFSSIACANYAAHLRRCD